jgi:hypothetical protein
MPNFGFFVFFGFFGFLEAFLVLDQPGVDYSSQKAPKDSQDTQRHPGDTQMHSEYLKAPRRHPRAPRMHPEDPGGTKGHPGGTRKHPEALRGIYVPHNIHSTTYSKQIDHELHRGLLCILLTKKCMKSIRK